MKRAAVNGAELEYELLGDGPQLVWLHGLGGNLELERRTAVALAENFQVLWYSSRGHGRSSLPGGRESWTYRALAGDLDAMLDVAGFEQPMLVGVSHGANTILRHAVEHPGRTGPLMVIAPGGNALGRPSRRLFAPLWLALQWARLHGQNGLIRYVTGQDPGNPDMDQESLAAARTHDPKVLARALRRMPDQGAVDVRELPSVKVPTIVAGWEDDPIIHPIALARHVAEVIPDARFEVISPLVNCTPQEVALCLSRCVQRWDV